MSLQTVLDYTLASGGGTFDPDTLQPAQLTSGYGVSMDEYGVKIPAADLTPAVISTYQQLVNKVIWHDDPENYYIGTWVNDGNVHLDVTQVFNNKDYALRRAEDWDQLAIWDFTLNSEILVPTTEIAA